MIIALQNGIGPLERLRSSFGQATPPHGLAAVNTRPFWFNLQHAGQPVRTQVLSRDLGGVALQADHPEALAVAALLRQAGLPVHFGWAEELLWSSVFWHLQANALSAILDRAPQDIYRDPVWLAVELAQLREALRVIDAQGVRLTALPGVNVPLMARQVRWLPRPALALALSAHPRPPALRNDLQHHSGYSDAAYFNGAVAVAAQQHRLRAPINHALAVTLTDLAEGRLDWPRFKREPGLLQAALRLAQKG
ncbi:MAG: hypothetical protein HC915_04735 [Anaerolineae bacterium]|nr:hypothetical protein [Anaerolineae bacterium]